MNKVRLYSSRNLYVLPTLGGGAFFGILAALNFYSNEAAFLSTYPIAVEGDVSFCGRGFSLGAGLGLWAGGVPFGAPVIAPPMFSCWNLQAAGGQST